jgi:hypothetical protein
VQGRERGGHGAEPPPGHGVRDVARGRAAGTPERRGAQGRRKGRGRGRGRERGRGEGSSGIQLWRSPSPKPRAPRGRKREVAAQEKSNERKGPGGRAHGEQGAPGARGLSRAGPGWAGLGWVELG